MVAPPSTSACRTLPSRLLEPAIQRLLVKCTHAGIYCGRVRHDLTCRMFWRAGTQLHGGRTMACCFVVSSSASGPKWRGGRGVRQRTSSRSDAMVDSCAACTARACRPPTHVSASGLYHPLPKACKSKRITLSPCTMHHAPHHAPPRTCACRREPALDASCRRSHSSASVYTALVRASRSSSSMLLALQRGTHT